MLFHPSTSRQVKDRYRVLSVVSALLSTLLLTGRAHAGPADYVYVPSVISGEHEIDFKAGMVRRSGEGRESAASLGYGYGNLKTARYLKIRRWKLI